MTPSDYVRAARCPAGLTPRTFGLWSIERRYAMGKETRRAIGGDYQTLLRRVTLGTLHQDGGGEIVMEDSIFELRKHLPIWMNAAGEVLVTGLGLGCVVRGLLANPDVERITVVEIDQQIIDAIWPEFQREERAMVLHGDALTMEFPPATRFDYAWHDLWTEGDKHLQILHGELLVRYRDIARQQGAWQLPRVLKRLLRQPHDVCRVALIG